ncbi:Flp pilus assembly protein CpaB [Nitrosococcus halophilus Nc 4]|uniref:Flp pilus assembly protein CpaB n=1 Tax=Nitrosococcus halophilus (strain Nc4) TaxID=472759 RepID=D5C113_NITHN|nr:Flp pilus assembly protein CpaB [Nitrosococcus halophilus]ADE14570.1 Flp pilus assembly protein CpaB [Nitrosococcus halophilus Nc 4]
MIKRKSLMLFFIAIVLGTGATWMANQWLQDRMQPGPVEVVAPETAPVVVAALEIPFGQKIETMHLKVISWPADNMPEGIFHETSAVEGRVASQKIYPGEPIMKDRAVEQLGGSTLSAIVPRDKRAVTVRVNDVIGVAGFLLPGNQVDVLSSRKIDRSQNKVQIETILQNLKVLAVDQTASQDKNQPLVVRAVTLEADPKQAEKLFKATEEGTIQLVLRNPQDVAVIKDPEPVKVAKKTYSKAPQPISDSVTVIRGTQVDISKVRL